MTAATFAIRGQVVAQHRERELRARIFVPPPKLTVSEWADAHRMLTSIASAEPGRWRTDRAPYQRGIMDAFSDPTIERVVVMSSAQVGKTEIVLNVAGYFMDQDPAPILVLQPTIDMARAFSKDRLREMLRASPKLRGKVHESGRRDADDTILHKQFPGGHITMVGANSAAGLASRPIRVVLKDEKDRFPASAGHEGDPSALADARTVTFWNRKIGEFSTPTIKSISRIEAAFEEGDKRRYHVSCPHCGHAQHLRWAQIDFETASYVCEGCGCLIAEGEKPTMLARGRWIAEKPTARIASFHLNALYSPWVSWRELIEKFQVAKKSIGTLQVFVNTVLGETWVEDGESANVEGLPGRRETYAAEVPRGAGVLVAAIDVQRDRLELQVKGYGAGQESWLIGHHRLYGDPQSAALWERADALLLKRYQHESGATLTIQSTCVDSGDGATTQAVYTFVKPRQRRGVRATKGLSVRDRPIISRASRPNKYGVRIVPIGTEIAKDLVFDRLRVSAPGHPGYMHFPQPGTDGGDNEYLAQFGAEKAFTRYTRMNVPVREYRRVRDRNEAIDLEVLSIAALHLLGAGVYDQLGLWVQKVCAEGDALAKAAGQSPDPATMNWKPARPAGPRRPGGGGYVNRWRG